MDREDVSGLLAAVGNNIQTFVGSDGVALLAGELEAVNEVDRALDDLESAEHTSYLVQLHVVETRQSRLVDFGLDGVPLIELSAKTLANGSTPALAIPSALSAVTSVSGKAQLDALLRASGNDRDTHIVIDPLLCCLAGAEAIHSDQIQYPLQNTTTNAQSGQTQQGVSFVPVGLKLTVSVSATRRDVARVNFSLEDGTIVGTTPNGLPQMGKRLFASTYDLPLGETVLVGSMRRQTKGEERGKLLQWGRKRDNSSALWILFAHVIQVTA